MGTLVPAEVFKKIGLYNEDYLPHYYADSEFSLRAKKLGYGLLFNPNAKLWNNTESSWFFPKKFYPGIFKDLLFHTRSPYFLKATLFYYYNYWPKLIWFVPFLILYIKCFIGILLAMKRSVINKK